MPADLDPQSSRLRRTSRYMIMCWLVLGAVLIYLAFHEDVSALIRANGQTSTAAKPRPKRPVRHEPETSPAVAVEEFARRSTNVSGARPDEDSTPPTRQSSTDSEVFSGVTTITADPPESRPALVVHAQIGNEREGTVFGQVRLEGTPPPEKPLDIARNDPRCARLLQGTPSTQFYLVGSKGELADAIVYLEPLNNVRKTDLPREPLVIESTNCQFVPYIAAIQAGQKVIVRNKDPLLHSSHFTPASGTRNREIDRALMPKSETSVSFSDPESFLRLKCDVHPWEFAYISVFEHPFFAVTDREGRFAITNLPPGNYRLHASHRKAGTITGSARVRTGSSAEVAVTLTAK